VKRKVLVITAVVVAIVGGLAITWLANDRPPLGLVLSHGLPAGRREAERTVVRRVGSADVEFVEVRAGYVWIDRHEDLRPDGFFARALAALGLRRERNEVRFLCNGGFCEYWAVVPEAIWLARDDFPVAALGEKALARIWGKRSFADNRALRAALTANPAGPVRPATQVELDYAIDVGLVEVPRRLPAFVEVREDAGIFPYEQGCLRSAGSPGAVFDPWSDDWRGLTRTGRIRLVWEGPEKR
jgi:hypothetical protein